MLDHDYVLRQERGDMSVDFVIFEGFHAFHDVRAVELIDVLIWLQAFREFALIRRLKRNKSCTEDHFEDEVWHNHIIYERDVLKSLGSKMYRFAGDSDTTLQGIKGLLRLQSDGLVAAMDAAAVERSKDYCSESGSAGLLWTHARQNEKKSATVSANGLRHDVFKL